MINHEVEPGLLEPHVPAGTELDFWNGRTFVSLVGFQFRNTRVRGIPIPFHRNFPEVNLRFYVRHRRGGEERRGVCFVRELVPRRAIASVARWLYHENYHTFAMRYVGTLAPDSRPQPPTSIGYHWKSQGRWIGIQADLAGEAAECPPKSEPQFITEHYWGYTNRRHGGTHEYQVEHPPWRIWEATSVRVDPAVTSFYGPAFEGTLNRPHSSAFIADGSPVLVHQGRPIESLV